MCASFTKCITKIDGTRIDDAEDLDLVMLLLGSLWLYSKHETTNFNADIENTDEVFQV